MAMKYLYIFLLFFSNIVFAQISGKVIGIKNGDTVVIFT